MESSDRGGGVLVATKKHLIVNFIDTRFTSESLFLSLRLPDCKILLGATYLPPGSPTEFYEDFTASIGEALIGREDLMLFLGVFNIPDVKCFDDPLNFQTLDYGPPSSQANFSTICQFVTSRTFSRFTTSTN